jgi:D-alanyl-D-alanine-carboxypeptidase/D-alanyl-D-alanine-endopeptidase
VWVELVLAVIVEGYREFLEWWQTRGFLRRPASARGDEPLGASDRGRDPAPAVSSRVAREVALVLDRHARKHVGTVVGVRLGHESWTFAHGRIAPGRAEAPRADTIFEIGSITKVFTALVLADMVEEGVVGLHDPVQRYLPDGVTLPVRGRPLTLADLATQTSGLPRLPRGLIRMSLRDRKNPYARFGVRHLERAIRTARLRSDPGKKLHYSNFGFGLLGHVLGLRAGLDFERLVRERVCDAAGLVDTRISVPAHDLPRFADGHDRRGRPVPHWQLPALAGAGALRSTVADLLRFLDLQLEPPPTRLGRPARATQEPRVRRGRMWQGLGWVSLPLRGRPHRMLWHNGGTGGFRSFVGFVPETRTGVVVLSNCARSVDAIGFRIVEAIGEPDA